jgi:general stress protein YciG
MNELLLGLRTDHMTTNTTGRTPARRGFAVMDKERQLAIARKGGQSVPDDKRSFSQDRALAASAGRKGGEASHGGGRRPATATT